MLAQYVHGRLYSTNASQLLVPAATRRKAMEAACAENRKRGFAMGGSVTKTAIFLHRRQ